MRTIFVRSIVVLTLLVAALAIDSPGTSRALQAPGFQALSIDMNPSGNTGSSLSAHNECAEALPGDTLSVDITVTAIPSSTPMIGYAYKLRFDGPPLVITGQEPLMIATAANSSVLNVSDPTPQFGGSFAVSVADLSAPGSSESGNGVLDRLTLDVSTDAAPGVYELKIDEAAYIDPNNDTRTPMTIQEGRLAVGLSCTSSTPLPTRTPGVIETGSATPTQPPISGDPTATGGTATPTQSPETNTPPISGEPTPTPTPTPGSPVIGSDDDSGLSTGVLAVIAATLAGLIAAAAAGFFAYRVTRG